VYRDTFYCNEMNATFEKKKKLKHNEKNNNLEIS
jgi:hypothetical protein